MKNLYALASLCFVVLSISLSSCKKEETVTETPPNPIDQLELLGSGYALGAATHVKVFGTESAFVGYNNIYIALYDSVNENKIITNAMVSIQPMMDMGAMMHSAPFEQPLDADTKTKLFNGAIVFIMPSTAGTWTLHVTIHNHETNSTGMAMIPISVTAPTTPVLFNFISQTDQKTYFVALLNPQSPKVGVNDFTLGVYSRESMMSFPAYSDAVIEMTPEMPSMGHGSPNNINPVYTDGFYQGKVNFTMTGYWKVNLDFFSPSGDTMTTGQSFDITF